MSSKLRLFLATLFVAYPLDQATKLLVASRFYYGESVTIIPGFFDLTYVRNPGGAFSVFASGPHAVRLVFFIGTGLLAVGLLVVLFRRLESHALLASAALGTILGGALGNLTDRIRVGEVIDFLDFHVAGYTWPTFNVADSCIVIGVSFLIFEIFMVSDDASGAARQEATRSDRLREPSPQGDSQ